MTKRMKESRDAKDFNKLKIGQAEAVNGVVATVKEDLYKKGHAKHKMAMNHQPDWKPGEVTTEYRNNYDLIKWG